MRFVRCETCQREAAYAAPPEWICTIRRTIGGNVEEQHFCSKRCVALGHWPNGLAGPVQRATLRRFLFIDGETANEIEAVKWSSGSVTLDPGKAGQGQTYQSWDVLKHDNPGCGVTWIDQEGRDASDEGI